MISDNKKALRKKIIHIRNCLTKDELCAKSSRIMKKLENTKAFKQSNFILCYVDFRNEVMTRDFIKRCMGKGKRIAVPLIENGKGIERMSASEINSIDNDLEPGFFGVYEPKRNCVQIVDPRIIDLIVVPGIAFDLEKNRLGYGGGFFDQFIREVRTGSIKIAVAFDLQVFDKIPAEPHDVKVDLIITESKIIR